jgi:predicted transcriptional regulator
LEVNFDDLFKQLPNKPLLSLFEVASFLGISKRTVYRWYPEVLNGTNLNGSIRIYRCSVVEFVKQNHGKKETDEDVEIIEVKCKKDKNTSSKRSSWVKNWSGK